MLPPRVAHSSGVPCEEADTPTEPCWVHVRLLPKQHRAVDNWEAKESFVVGDSYELEGGTLGPGVRPPTGYSAEPPRPGGLAG